MGSQELSTKGFFVKRFALTPDRKADEELMFDESGIVLIEACFQKRRSINLYNEFCILNSRDCFFKLLVLKRKFLAPIWEEIANKYSRCSYRSRSEASKTYYRDWKGHEFRYADVINLYPYICKYGKFPSVHDLVRSIIELAVGSWWVPNGHREGLRSSAYFEFLVYKVTFFDKSPMVVDFLQCT